MNLILFGTMGIETIKKFENVLVAFLNMDGWNLEWTGDGFKHYDACGFTPKGNPCVIEMKFRNKYYEKKMLEKMLQEMLQRMKGIFLTEEDFHEYIKSFGEHWGSAISKLELKFQQEMSNMKEEIIKEMVK